MGRPTDRQTNSLVAEAEEVWQYREGGHVNVLLQVGHAGEFCGRIATVDGMTHTCHKTLGMSVPVWLHCHS